MDGNGFPYISFTSDGTGNTIFNLQGPQALSQSTWYHLAATFDSTASTPTVCLYVNGVQVNSTGWNGPIFDAQTANFTVGCQGPPVVAAEYFFPGIIDAVRIYNTALTGDTLGGGQIGEIYGNPPAQPGLASAGSAAGTPSNGVYPSLVGWWQFDEGSGNSASDSSGNNNPGTETNFPTPNTQYVASTVLG